MAGIDIYQDPYDWHAPVIVTPQPDQTIKIVIPDTHVAGPDKDIDGMVVIRPKETT